MNGIILLPAGESEQQSGTECTILFMGSKSAVSNYCCVIIDFIFCKLFSSYCIP